MHSRILLFYQISLNHQERNAGDTRKGCSFENSYSKDRLRCHKPSRWPSARTKEDQMNAFFDQADFGYSWGHELSNFESSSEYAVTDKNCDIIYERPTILFKLDASVNMYHHFCDFINLFASQFINGTFNDDVDIMWWETVDSLIIVFEVAKLYSYYTGYQVDAWCHLEGLL
ncbi:hypothetical protein QR680_019434 [Steinernema hermaphroditum]|uniref:Uncharacterized protein n=1 Tax=Steinernema hermaphroditum TaxID=289476 RepID=A0AA39GPH7_9BILA|nr:hypothetical protein QR680_019434 [Steinernema hermaphroditum]